jgi:hypothetical protein
MSRISSFSLYKCTNCGQIHTRPVWGTYRVGNPPNDFGVATEILKTCAKCGLKQPIKDYLLIGETEGSGDYAPVRWLIPSEAPPIPKKSTADLLVGLFKQKRTLDGFQSFKD